MNIGVKTERVFNELYNDNAFTFVGLSLTDDLLEMLNNVFEENDLLAKPIENLYVLKGEYINNLLNLTGDNRYPDDLTIISIKLDNFKNIGKLAIFKLKIGARWFNDIVDNNLRREGL